MAVFRVIVAGRFVVYQCTNPFSSKLRKFTEMKRMRERLALASSSARVDDLDYALEGLRASSSLAVLRRSALDVASLCADATERAQLFRSHGVLERIVAATETAAPSNDPLYAAALGAVLYALSHDTLLLSDDNLVGPLASSLLLRLAAFSSAAPSAEHGEVPPRQPDPWLPSPPMGRSELEPVWSRMCRLCVGAVKPDARCPAAMGELLELVRRLCTLGLAACARASPEACRRMRAHAALHALPAIIDEHVAAARPLPTSFPSHDEMYASLAILEAASFPAEAGRRVAGRSSGPSSAAIKEPHICRPGGRALDVLPVIRAAERAAALLYGLPEASAGVAGASSSATAFASPTAAAAAATTPTAPALPAPSPAVSSAPSSGSSVRRRATATAASRVTAPAAAAASAERVSPRGAKRRAAGDPMGICAAESSFEELRAAERPGTPSPGGGVAPVMRTYSRRNPSPAAARMPATVVTDLFDPKAFGSPAGPVSQPEASPAGAAPAAATTTAAAASPIQGAVKSAAVAPTATLAQAPAGPEAARRLLGHSLRTLVNLTHGSSAGCQAFLANGVPLAASVLSEELKGSARRNGLARHFDTALMAIGVLTNCLEMCPQDAPAVGAHPCMTTAERLDDDDERSHLGDDGSTRMDIDGDAGRAAEGIANCGTRLPLIALLARTLRALLTPVLAPAAPLAIDTDETGKEGAIAAAAAEAQGSEAAAAAEKLAMEREVFAAYTALLLGFVCRQHAPHARMALRGLHATSFGRVSKLLQSFLELQSEAHLIDDGSAATMSELVQWLTSAAPLAADE